VKEKEKMRALKNQLRSAKIDPKTLLNESKKGRGQVKKKGRDDKNALDTALQNI
jgi:hypothetical protein